MDGAKRNPKANFAGINNQERNNNPMKLTSITSLAGSALLALALVANCAKADPVYGDITFNGTGKVTGSLKLHTVTKVTPSNPFKVAGPTLDDGDYGTIAAGTLATFASPISVANIAVENVQLWTLSFGGNTYSFNATSESYSYFAGALTIGGSGTAYENGTDANTAGTWDIQVTGSGPTFSFQSTSNVVEAPDSGSTALLITLGAAALAVGAIAQRRRLVKA